MVTALDRQRTTSGSVVPTTRLFEDDGGLTGMEQGNLVVIIENPRFSGLTGFLMADGSDDLGMYSVTHYRANVRTGSVQASNYLFVKKLVRNDGDPYHVLTQNDIILFVPSRMPYEYCLADGKDFADTRRLLSDYSTFGRGLERVYSIVSTARPGIFKVNGLNLEMPDNYANLIPRRR